MRKEGWEARLYEFLEAAGKRPFSWKNRWHCCEFVRQALSAQCEIEIEVPDYSGKRGAAKVVKSFGGFEPLVETLANDLGLTEIPPLTAQRGDVVMIEEGEKLIGISIGAKIAVLSEVGLIVKSIKEGKRAWRLP